MLEFNFIFCMDKDGGISKSGNIPWKIKEDVTYFKDVVTHKTNSKRNIVICGKKTFNQMGYFLNNLTIVLSKSLKDPSGNNNSVVNVVNVVNFESIETTLDFLKTQDYGAIYICGGKKVYDEFYNICLKYPDQFRAKIYATIINKSYDCDNLLNEHLVNKVKIMQKKYDLNSFIEHGIKIIHIEDSEQNKVEVLFLKPFDLTENFIKIHNQDELHYLKLIENILNAPEKVGRNGTTRSMFGEMLKFKLDKFPLLTTKRVFFKGVFEELMFFIKGDTNAKKLSEKDVKIWDLNTTKSFIQNCNLDYEEGDMGPMYGFQWRHFNAEYKGMEYDYSETGYDQLTYVLNELKTNPSSRRIIMSTYNPAQASQGVLYPCHGIGIVFNTRLDETDLEKNTYYLNVMQLQRSCDYFLGVPFNIASYSLLVYMICEVLNNDVMCKYKYKTGELTMSLGDYHLYETHYKEAKRQLIRTPNEFPTLSFNKKIYKMEDFTLQDINLSNYNCWPEIKAQMVS
jgi:dihydrofolate reductase/thymidylate synthase